jgi:hypothetical protein
VVEIKADGNLANVRGKLAALRPQRRALLDVPSSPKEMAEEVRAWVGKLAEQAYVANRSGRVSP